MTLNKIAWRFSEKFYANAQEFSKEVAQYQNDISKAPDKWQPEEIVMNSPEVQVQYMAWVKGPADLLKNERLIEGDQDVFEDEPDDDDGYYQVEIIAVLKADNGKDFTALEFLMKTHNQQANKELGDHVFFEGIDEEPFITDELPTYFIACGS